VLDERRRTRLELRQAGTDLVFEPSLRAATFRLSRPSVRLPSAFTHDFGTGFARATGGMEHGVMHASLDGAGLTMRANAELRATLGWSLLVPMPYDLGPEVPWITTLFIASMVATWSFWLGAAATGARTRWVVAIGAAMLAIGLGAIPALFALPKSRSWEWGVAVGALIIGIALGRIAATNAHASRAC
jgi:hypothetical protein